jgi:hypothetical protein
MTTPVNRLSEFAQLLTQLADTLDVYLFFSSAEKAREIYSQNAERFAAMTRVINTMDQSNLRSFMVHRIWNEFYTILSSPTPDIAKAGKFYIQFNLYARALFVAHEIPFGMHEAPLPPKHLLYKQRSHLGPLFPFNDGPDGASPTFPSERAARLVPLQQFRPLSPGDLVNIGDEEEGLARAAALPLEDTPAPAASQASRPPKAEARPNSTCN